MLILKNADGGQKAVIEPNDSSRQESEIQGEDVLSLSFTLYEFVAVEVNDYIDFLGKKYSAMERYVPRQKSTVEWVYDMQLYGPDSHIKRYLVNHEGNVVFSFTGTPTEHLELIIGCINSAQPQGLPELSVGTVASEEEITIDYNATYCNEALQQVAEKTGQEFWFQDTQVNLCKCELGDEIALRYGQELTNIERETNNNQKFFTRLYPIGSKKNIDVSEYGYDRLKLPETSISRHYLDSPARNLYGIIEHAEEEVFEDIYPIYVGTVGEVASLDSGKIFFRDLHLTFNPNEYQIGGQDIFISFLSGPLVGCGDCEDGSFTVDFDYENLLFIIQKENSIPVRGNRYVITNISTPPILIKKAEQELLDKAMWYMEQSLKDNSTYKVQTNHVVLEQNNIELTLGQLVRLESEQFFATGSFSSRITRISRHVNTPQLMDIEISDTLTESTFQSLANKVNLTYDALIEANKKDYDKTPETDEVEWNADKGVLPRNHNYIKLSEQIVGERLLLPYNRPLTDNMPYVIYNTSRYEKTLDGDGRKIKTLVYDSGSWVEKYVDSMIIGAQGLVVLFYIQEDSGNCYWYHKRGIPH